MALMIRTYQTQVIRTLEQTSCIRTIQLAVPENYPDFIPGQHIRLSTTETAQLEDTKAFCLCSLPEDRVLEIAVDLVNPLGLSGSLFGLEEGASILTTAPSGQFGQLPQSPKPLVFVGLGSGTGTLLGILRHYLLVNPMTMNDLLFVAVNDDETTYPYAAALEQLATRNKTLEVLPVLQDDGYDVDEIADTVLGALSDTQTCTIYLAGMGGPLQELRKYLGDAGIDASQIQAQSYA